MMKYIIAILFSFLAANAFSQYNVGIGTTTPAKDAILDIKSSTQGVLLPRLSTTQRLAIVNPSNGLMVFDTNYNCIYVYIAPSAVWQSYCPPPVGPPVNSNVQVYTSQGDSTLITKTTMTTVKGLSLTVTLTDTATVILSSNGSFVYQPCSGGLVEALFQLYVNAAPIPGTNQNNQVSSGACCAPAWPLYSNWSVSTVLSLLPGTYLFELKTAIAIPSIYNCNYYAAYNCKNQNQGIISAEVIYK